MMIFLLKGERIVRFVPTAQLLAMMIFLLIALKTDKGILKAFTKICCSMLLACKEVVSGGICKVNWQKVCGPKELGGIGIRDLENFSRALRLRWLWYEWTALEKPWVGSETPNDASNIGLFNAATRVTIGDGAKASFWPSSWFNRIPPKDLAPLILKASNVGLLGNFRVSLIIENNITDALAYLIIHIRLTICIRSEHEISSNAR
jgi:hypothetical protein